ncbi:MAG TPA: rod shape-determining protein [Clostridiales bacterium]|nr:rod shape-determining protein [Clostridiales bacterium]
MALRKFGVDLGTNTIKIYQKDQGLVLDEHNTIAISNGKVFAIGNEAYEMYERNPEEIEIIFPVNNGVIADVANMILLINNFMNKINGNKRIGTSDFIIATPTDITEVEKRAFYELIANSNLRAGNIKIAEKPIADALGLGLDITNAHGVMLVNIGADTTEISVLSLGGIVLSKLVPVGGNKLDESIQTTIKKNHNLFIGSKTAELIKRELSSAVTIDDKSIEIFGRHVVTGLPTKVEITSMDVYEAISEHLFTIIDSIKSILERTPPEMSSDIIEGGIHITGGSAKIRNLDLLISKETNLKTNISKEPSDSVVKGLGEILENAQFVNLSSTLKPLTLNS